MTQLQLIQTGTDQTITLPALEYGPVTHPLGQIRSVLRPEQRLLLRYQGEIAITARIKEPVYQTPDGEKIILTARPKLDRPSDVSGIIRVMPDSKLKWLSHEILDAFTKDIADRGLA